MPQLQDSMGVYTWGRRWDWCVFSGSAEVIYFSCLVYARVCVSELCSFGESSLNVFFWTWQSVWAILACFRDITIFRLEKSID